MATLRETIAVIDKSGKMVTTSKHLFGVFKEARNAYRERKAEIRAVKDAEKQAQIAEQEARRAMANLAIDDRQSVASSRRSSRTKTSQHRYASSHTHRANPSSGFHYEQDIREPRSIREVGRHHTSHELYNKEPITTVARSRSSPNIDMDLAYGEVHPSALEHYEPKPADEQELNGLVARAKDLLEEAECVQHTATATIAHLQKNPDAMAAVALTLAEISNLTAKMAPAILAGLKVAAPSVFALLASPQFLTAVGVGVGVTIVMFGGYKIIKKLTEASPTTTALPPAETPQLQFGPQPKEPSSSVDELLELQTEHLDSVEVWRRGVADYEASSVGSTVDGEFITRTAAMMSGLDLSDPTIFRNQGPEVEQRSVASSRRSKHSRHSRHSRHSGRESSSRSMAGDPKKKKAEPKRSSKLRMMFTA